MLFNSIDFAIFLPIVFVAYWSVSSKNIKLQNLILLISSYVFYSWWDFRFLSLILISTIVDFLIGIMLNKSENARKRKALLILSICINLGILFYFKYYNFFIQSFVEAFTLMGKSIEHQALHIILPVGISFYTFQTLSYTIDVYRNKIHPTNNILAFSVFISFFPQLVAGPIERAKNLLPQFLSKRNFNYQKSKNGLRQILWGLFKKIVIADSCAPYVNEIFSNYQNYAAETLILGAVLFSFQIYGDFSGYTDIAIGTAKLFGFDLKKNFAYPYFSRDIAEFWRRWHISLTSWFKDYVYIPLGGSRGSLNNTLKNVFIVFFISGLWHGANWTFIIWGFLNALYFVPLLLFKKNRAHINIVSKENMLPAFKDMLLIFITFGLTTFAWIFFRAESLTHAVSYIRGLVLFYGFENFVIEVKYLSVGASIIYTISLTALMFILEWIQRTKDHALQNLESILNVRLRWSVYYIIVFLIIYYNNNEQDFIYFQF